MGQPDESSTNDFEQGEPVIFVDLTALGYLDESCFAPSVFNESLPETFLGQQGPVRLQESGGIDREYLGPLDTVTATITWTTLPVGQQPFEVLIRLRDDLISNGHGRIVQDGIAEFIAVPMLVVYADDRLDFHLYWGHRGGSTLFSISAMFIEDIQQIVDLATTKISSRSDCIQNHEDGIGSLLEN